MHKGGKMQNIKRLTGRAMPVVLAVIMIVSMCLTVLPGPQTADAGEGYPELIAPGHTTHLNEGQFYVITAKLANETEETLTELYARIYAKQAESDDSMTPGAPSILVIDPAPVAPGTQDGGQDFDHDGDGWIENGDPSLAGLPLPAGWPDDNGLTSAGPDDGRNNVVGDHESDDEGTGDNAWPWIPTWDAAGGDLWMTLKGLVDTSVLVPDCIDTINGAPSAANNYSNDFCSFNHIRLTGDEPHVKQLDPLPTGQEQTVAWQIQCIGTGDVDIRVYFWEEGHEGLMTPQFQELDCPCHESLPDPADRDDWWNQVPIGGNGVQIDEDWIWFTESQLICQGPIQVPDIEIEFIDIPDCIPVGQEFELEAVVTNNTPCEVSECGNPGWAMNVVARIDPASLFPKIQAAVAGGTIVYVGNLAPGASATVTFYLRCLEEGLQANVEGLVSCEPDTCTPSSCYQCYYDTDFTDIWQCGKPELEVEIISPADFMWDPYQPLYEGAAIHTGGEFAITARVWNIGAERAENVWATLRDIPLDPKTEEPYFDVIDYEVKTPLAASASPEMYQDMGMQTWIPYSYESWITNEDTYITNYDMFGYMKYLDDIDMGDYKIVEWTIMPTDVWTESLQTCDPAEVTGFTVTARRENGYPQASGAMIDDGPDRSSIAAWIADWSTGPDVMDDTCCNEAHCGNSFVSLQGTPHPWYPWDSYDPYYSGTPEVQIAIDNWIEAGSQARVVVPEPMSFDLLDHIGVFVNSGTEATYGGPGSEPGDLEVGLGPYCAPCGGTVQAVNLPIIQINIETLTQDVWVGNTYSGGDWLETADTDIRIFYQPGTPGWRHYWQWPTQWLTDADCSTWQYYGTMGTLPASYIKPGDGTRTYPADYLMVDGGYGWVIDWAEYDETGGGALQGGNLSGFAHYTWAEIQNMFDRGTGTPAIATVKSFEIRNNHSGTPVFVDDIRIWDDFHGDLMKGDGPSEYTNDCINANYLDCNCPGIIETTQVLIYPAADIEVIIDGPEVVSVDIGGQMNLTGVIKNRGAASAWDVDLEMAIEKQPGLYPSAVAGPDAYSKHFMSIPGGEEREFSWTLNAYEVGAYRIDLVPSGMDECGWHVKQNTDPYLDPNYEDKYEIGGKGNLLLVDDSSDYPINWIRGDAITAAIGIALNPGIGAEITYPENGDMFWKETTVAITAELENNGLLDLTGVEATLSINDIGGTGTTIDGSAVYAVSGTLTPGSKDLATWSITTGDITGDCVLKIVVTSNEGAMDMDAVTIKVDPKVTLRLLSGPGGGIGTTADIAGEGDYMFDSGEVVDIKAVANPGQEFVKWVGDTATVGDVEDATTTVTMNAHYQIIATFDVEMTEWKEYDLNDNDDIEYDEMIAALTDYVMGYISYDLMIEVLIQYVL